MQVGGLFVPGLLAPDPARLWNVGGTGDYAGRLGRAAWAVAKAVGVVAVAGWFLRGDLGWLMRLATLEPAELAASASRLILDAARALAVVILGLGAIDYLLSWRRVESQLSLTPDEYREELRATDGDPALQARRRKLALSWRQDAAEVLPGSALCLFARGGVAVLLGGGPPPCAVTVRHIAQGVAATLLRRDAERAGVPCLESPRLARHFARGRAAGTALPPALADELQSAWPRSSSS
jgi:flagellar biosynthesis protein FlhB